MEKIKLTGLWKNEDKNGNGYYAGSLSPGVRIMIFKNGFKNGERDPDAILYLAPSERQKDGDGSPPEPENPTDSKSPPF